MGRLGYKFSDESRLKMRLAHLGKTRGPHSSETKIKMSLAAKGKKKSKKHCTNLTIAALNKYKNGFVSPLKNIWEENPDFLRGKNNPRWIKDRNKIKIGDRVLHDPLYKQWHMSVKNRDGWKCKISNDSCSGRLEAHHILQWKDFPELRYEVNNGITLCHAHHPRKKEDVAKLSPYFKQLVASLD